ncbi:MAG TPA: IPExxxVDY family protein [Bacteroidales bacterium]|nr:IPExxxVDY family protein [Bacteroidales bacterium]
MGKDKYMKSGKKITRIKLENVANEINSLVFGIVSAEPDYKISIALNRKLNISLKKTIPYEISGNKQSFSRFIDFSGMPETSFVLVSNKSGDSFLSKKYSRIDYFLKLSGSIHMQESGKLLSSLREINGIVAVFPLKSNEFDINIFNPY